MSKVSVIIPTYNRFKYLMNTIKSIKAQTHTNIEIIVVNDCSSQKEYYEYEWPDVTIVHLETNTKAQFGYACAGFVRNQGIARATGEYIAFCDDDDIWFPHKLELQLAAMRDSGCNMSSTEGLIGKGPYNVSTTYKKFNGEWAFQYIQRVYAAHGVTTLPPIWTYEFLKINNCMICSSVIIHKTIIDKIGHMDHVKNGQEDYNYWLRALKHTNSVYVTDVCFYYDLGHGDGQLY